MYPQLIDGARKLIVLDSFGHSKPEVISSLPIVTLGFPIASISRHISKIKLIAGTFEGLMHFYHAPNDVPGNIAIDNLEQTEKLLHRLIQKRPQ